VITPQRFLVLTAQYLACDISDFWSTSARHRRHNLLVGEEASCNDLGKGERGGALGQLDVFQGSSSSRTELDARLFSTSLSFDRKFAKYTSDGRLGLSRWLLEFVTGLQNGVQRLSLQQRPREGSIRCSMTLLAAQKNWTSFEFWTATRFSLLAVTGSWSRKRRGPIHS
jgi:hypothetical protein